MQRTIRFRGKTKVGKEWVYGYVYETQIFIDGNPCQDVMIIDDFTVIPETVGQFTGLEDKNGKEIYEGDICKVTWSRLDGETAYNTTVIKNPFDYSLDEIAWLDHSHEFEIIGNIHDNSELLGGSK